MAKKLPGDTRRGWVTARAAAEQAGRTTLQAIQQFMSEERDKQRSLGYLNGDDPNDTTGKSGGSSPKDLASGTGATS